MKKTNALALVVCLGMLFCAGVASGQNNSQTVVNVQYLKLKFTENGSPEERDSLVAIYNDNVVKKNEHILSHREYYHFFTGDNQDYMVIEEYKDLAGMEASFLRTTELEKMAWPDEKKRKEFFKNLDVYFERWHGDALYHTNHRLDKN